MHTPFSPNQAVRKIAQLAVIIQAAASDLSGYEVFFGAENVGYIREGAAKMVWVAGEALAHMHEPASCLSKEKRHDLRNHAAVVKGFSDLILMDLPVAHSARPQLEDLAAKCMEFVHLLDEHRDAASGPARRVMAG